MSLSETLHEPVNLADLPFVPDTIHETFILGERMFYIVEFESMLEPGTLLRALTGPQLARELPLWFDAWYGAKMLFINHLVTPAEFYAIAAYAKAGGINHIISDAGFIDNDGTIIVKDTGVRYDDYGKRYIDETVVQFDIDNLTPPDLIDDDIPIIKTNVNAFTPWGHDDPFYNGTDIGTITLADLAVDELAADEVSTVGYTSTADTAPAFVFNPEAPVFVPRTDLVTDHDQPNNASSSAPSSSSIETEIERDLCANAAQLRIEGSGSKHNQ